MPFDPKSLLHNTDPAVKMQAADEGLMDAWGDDCAKWIVDNQHTILTSIFSIPSIKEANNPVLPLATLVSLLLQNAMCEGRMTSEQSHATIAAAERIAAIMHTQTHHREPPGAPDAPQG